MSSTPFSRVAVLSPGLLGGSITKCLAAKNDLESLSVWARNPEVLTQIDADQLGINTFEAIEEAVSDADLVVLCSPVTVMPDLVQRISQNLKPGAMITDVGSSKSWLQKNIPPLLPSSGLSWIGSHPMAGSENGGYESSRADLFKGATTIITTDAAENEQLERLEAFWTSCGSSQVLRMSSEEHDDAIASISHLPHLLSALLMNATEEEHLSCAGPGFRDMTRIAAGNPSLWKSILSTNREAVLRSVNAIQEQLSQTSAFLSSDDFDSVYNLLDEAAQKRNRFYP
ncbi:MAG: prephenate dehydrogenase/arogenate dehydrogenase family protein [Verrucomicrobiota bacterium]